MAMSDRRELTPIIKQLPTPEFWEHECNAVRLLLDFECWRNIYELSDDVFPGQFHTLRSDIVASVGTLLTTGVESIIDTRNLNLTSLAEGGVRRKPRVSLCCSLIDESDLSVTWAPQHTDLSGRPIGHNDWTMGFSGSGGGWGRPTNELLFIRAVSLMRNLNDGRSVLSFWVYSNLLCILNAMLNSLERFLAQFLDLQISKRLKISIGRSTEYGLDEVEELFGTENTVATGFCIVDQLAEERTRLNKLLQEFKLNYGVDPGDFLLLLEAASALKARPSMTDVCALLSKHRGEQIDSVEALKLGKDIRQALKEGVWLNSGVSTSK